VRRSWLWTLLLATALAACGGGGGGDDDSDGPPGSIDISTANREPVTRAVMVTVQGGGIGGSLGIAGSGSPSALAAPGLRRALLAGVRAASLGTRESRAGVIGPERVDCAVSGFATVTLDDADNDGQPSVGDVLSVAFSACSDIAGESINGNMAATYTQIVASPLTVGASVSVSNLAATEGGYRAELAGAFAFTVREASASLATLNIVVTNALALRATTPVYTDTVTMQDGYTIAVTEDLAAVPPGGGTPGRTTTSVSGKVASATAGGTVQVNTVTPFVQYTDDDYPRAGAVGALGKNGSLQATVLSATEVRIEIDSDGNSSIDATVTLPWTDLL
jgi:hypothetical protein